MVYLSQTSRVPAAKLIDGSLRPCPQTPNCVSSEEQEGSKVISPLSFSSSAEKAWKDLNQAVKQTGGTVMVNEGSYLWATYTSRIFRFVDDMEFRLEAENKLIHVRSGSRVGKSDLGVNRKNVEALREQFSTMNDTAQ